MGVYRNKRDGSLEVIAGGTFYADNPIGTILAFGGSNVPTGWHLCDGTALSRTTYKDLFDVIGTNFGVGDGSTTFNLPDLQGEFLRGAGTNSHSGQGNGGAVGVHQDATSMPYVGNISGSPEWAYINSNTNSTAELYKNSDSYEMGARKGYYNIGSKTENSDNTPLYFTVRPTNTSVNYIIKIFKTGAPDDFQSVVDEALVEREAYSTTEVKTSKTWINGKPIYRKVFAGLDFGGTTDAWTPTGATIADVDALLTGYAIRYNAGTGYPDCNPIFNFGINGQNVQYYTSIQFPKINYLICEYTKTTD